jgi:flagellar basal-body rod protein FlgG
MMITASLYTSNSGLQSASNFLDNTSNNVANSSTVGYKTVETSFQDLFYAGLQPAAPTQGITPPGSTQYGNGATLSSTDGIFTQGALEPSTSGPLNLAINGNGFFAVTLPDGSTGYTRAGDFTFDGAGHIVTSDGFILAGITIPVNTSSVSVSASGAVSATTPTGTVQVGQLQLTTFLNPGGLTRIGDTTFQESPATGAGITGTPGTNGLGTISSGFLEQSNVNLSNELVNLIVAQQAFAVNSEAVNVESETLLDTAQLLIQ